MKHHSDLTLRHLRNEIPLKSVIHALSIPWRRDDTKLRFICPKCEGLDTSVHSKVNLGRCFTCKINFNVIDMVMASKKLKFRMSVEWLMTLDKFLGSTDGETLLQAQARRTMLK
jgi:hypothetical protein